MKTIAGIIIVLLLAGLVPFGLVALSRSQTSSEPPVHPIQDLFKQQKFRPQRANAMFADGRAMRPVLTDVTARNDLEVRNEILIDGSGAHFMDGRSEPLKLDDELTYQRVTEGTEPHDGKPAYVKQFPIKVTADTMERGRQRFNIYCAACHGQGGYGDGMVARRAAEIQAANGDAAGWVAPKNYHTDDMRAQPIGQIFNTITNGARTMPSYAKQISIQDRWAIVAYVKALQRSQNAKAEDVPETEKDKFK